MSTLIIILVGVVIIIALAAVIYGLLKDRKLLKNQIKELTADIEKAMFNISQLADYIDKVQKIKSEEQKISEQIKEAKSDEEVYSIISNLIKSNNDKLRNKTKN